MGDKMGEDYNDFEKQILYLTQTLPPGELHDAVIATVFNLMHHSGVTFIYDDYGKELSFNQVLALIRS